MVFAWLSKRSRFYPIILFLEPCRMLPVDKWKLAKKESDSLAITN